MAKILKSFRLDSRICEILQAQAERDRRSMSSQLEFLIERYEKENVEMGRDVII